MSNPNTAEEIASVYELVKGMPEVYKDFYLYLESFDDEYLLVDIAQEHTAQTLDSLKEDIIADIELFGIPREFTHEDIMNAFDGSNPQEIGEIKAMLEFLNKIEEVSDE